ncbi:MAG: transposase, partial [Prevotellaceae bacterium]|nr:transposase [Prevotellaceae bacterium]
MLTRATSVPKDTFSTVGSCLERRYVSQRTARLNLFGMIDRKNHHEGFTTTESIIADKVVGFLNTFSYHVRKDTFVVLDNATVHRNHKIRELRPVWEKRGLFLFYLPP